MKNLNALWRGELPLNEAFWTWAVTVALLINISTSVLFLIPGPALFSEPPQQMKYPL